MPTNPTYVAWAKARYPVEVKMPDGRWIRAVLTYWPAVTDGGGRCRVEFLSGSQRNVKTSKVRLLTGAVPS